MKDNERHLQFVDTNIIVYSYDKSAGEKHRIAKHLMKSLWELRTGCISVQVLQEFYVTVTSKLDNTLDTKTASQIISGLSSWTLHSPSAEDVIHAILTQKRFNVSFWDAMIIHSAEKMKCSVLFSEDLNSGQTYKGVRVVNPFDTNSYNAGKFNGCYFHEEGASVPSIRE